MAARSFPTGISKEKSDARCLEDREPGQARFDENVLAGALADLLGDLMPSCDAVRSQLAVLEQHRQAAAPHPGNRREEQVAREDT